VLVGAAADAALARCCSRQVSQVLSRLRLPGLARRPPDRMV